MNGIFNHFKPHRFTNPIYWMNLFSMFIELFGGIFHFYSRLCRIFFKIEVKTLIRRWGTSDLRLHSLCMSHRKVAMLKWVNLVLYTQKKKFSQYRHCVQYFCKTVLILTKTLLKIKFM